MLTARASLAHRVRGLDEGADDYLVKPFALDELLGPDPRVLRRDTDGTSSCTSATSSSTTPAPGHAAGGSCAR